MFRDNALFNKTEYLSKFLTHYLIASDIDNLLIAVFGWIVLRYLKKCTFKIFLLTSNENVKSKYCIFFFRGSL